jgi:integrase
MDIKRFETIAAGPIMRGVQAEALHAAVDRAIETARGINRRVKLITNAAQALAAPPGFWRVSGATGLYLNVNEGGGRSWIWRYSFAGRRREMGIGAHPDVSMAEARDKATSARLERNRGVDPLAARRQKQVEAQKEPPVTFAEAVRRYLAAHGPTWKGAYAVKRWENHVKARAFAIIGDMPVNDIQVEHIAAIRRAADKAGFSYSGRRAVVRVKTVLDTAIAFGWRSAAKGNPADGKIIGKAIPSKPHRHTHFRRLELEQAPAAFRELHARVGEPLSITATLSFMILCASRPGEAAGTLWSEIDLERKLWTISPERVGSGKLSEPHTIPLSDAAIEILRLMAERRVGDAVAVFPKPRTRIHSEDVKRLGFNIGTPHSWRSIFRDWCGDLGRVDRDLAESALGHKLGKVEGAYRRGSAIEARRDVMERYSRWLLGETEAKVIQLPMRPR